MILYRVHPHDGRAAENEPFGPLWSPRDRQGAGRHDRPERYACLYLSEVAVSPVAESLAPFRGTGAPVADLLERCGHPLALTTLELSDEAPVVDLDDPATLARQALRPSRVATRRREITQADAEALYDRHPEVAGLRWWSTLEALWTNVTLFDRGVGDLKVVDVGPLAADDPPVREAAELFGLS